DPGTVVNGAIVNKARLNVGDQIQIGSTIVVLESVQPVAMPVSPVSGHTVAMAVAPMAGNPFAPQQPQAPAGNPFAAAAAAAPGFGGPPGVQAGNFGQTIQGGFNGPGYGAFAQQPAPQAPAQPAYGGGF